MRQWSNKQCERALGRNTQAQINGYAPTLRRRNRSLSRLGATALIVVFGLGAGWIAGKALSGAVGPSPPASDVSARDSSGSQPPTQTGAQPPSKDTSASSPPLPEPSPTVTKSVPATAPPEDKQVPADIPDSEQLRKEIGRKAYKKMLKELKKMNGDDRHGKGNDDNQDRNN